MERDAIWSGMVLSVGSGLQVAYPRYLLAVRQTAAGEPGRLWWEWEVWPGGDGVRVYKEYELPKQAAVTWATLGHVNAAAVVAVDRTPPPLPGGEDSSGVDAVVLFLGIVGAERDQRGRPVVPGRSQLRAAVAGLYDGGRATRWREV